MRITAGRLLDAVIDRVLAEVPLPTADAKGPARHIETMTSAYLRLVAERPYIFRVLATRRWRTPAEIAYQARLIELLVRAGLAPRAALRAARVLLVYLNGGGMALANWALDTREPPPDVPSATVKSLLRYSTTPTVATDVRARLQALLRSLVPGKAE